MEDSRAHPGNSTIKGTSSLRMLSFQLDMFYSYEQSCSESLKAFALALYFNVPVNS